MSPPDGASPGRSTVPFFVAALGITWSLQLPALLVVLGVLAGPVERFVPLAALGGFGPLIAALLAARFERGGQGVRALLGSLRAWRVGAGWYVVALGMPVAIVVAGAAVYSLLGGDPGPWFFLPTDPQRIVAMLVVPLVEEVGWRGFALPRLQRRHGPLVASLILGALWALWHIPMLLLVGTGPATVALLLLLFLPGSLVFTWLYNRTGGSLLLAVLMHVGIHLNNPHLALPANATPAFVQIAAYTVVALALLLLDRDAWPPRPPA